MRLSKLSVLLLVVLLMLSSGCIFGSKEYTISGTVLDEDDKPIDGVVIQITGGTTATVDKLTNGKWSASVKGTVTVTPVHEDYEFTPKSLEVKKADEKVNFVGKKLDIYSLAGTVVDENDNPLSNVKIKITGQVEREVEVDENGKFEIKDLRGTINLQPISYDFDNMYFFESVEVSEATTDLKLVGNYGIRALYNFEEVTDNTIIDSSKSGNNATLEGDATVSEGILSLDGENAYVNLPAEIVSDLDNFTISFLVNVKEIRAWSRFFDLAGPYGFFYMTPLGLDDSTMVTVFTNEYSIYGPDLIATDFTIDLISANKWILITVVVSDKELAVYYDDQLIGTIEAHAQPKDVGGTFDNYIGKSIFDADPYLYADFKDFRIYTNALTADQVSALYSLTE